LGKLRLAFSGVNGTIGEASCRSARVLACRIRLPFGPSPRHSGFGRAGGEPAGCGGYLPRL